MKKVSFKLNKKLDKDMINVFLDLKQGGLDFSGCVLNPNPELKKVIDKKDKDIKKEINKYVNRIYEKKKETLDKKVKEFNQRWGKLEKSYFNLIKDIFKLKTLPNHKYTGYLSIINCGPRFLEDRSFQVFYKKPNDSMYVTMHEILHFFFYDYVFKNYPKFRKLDPNKEILWELAEVFNSVILAESEFKKVHKQKRDWSYPAHRKYLKNLKKLWQESKCIDTWINKGFDYLKNKKY